MCKFNELVDSNTYLLNWKGYDERILSNQQPNGKLCQQLENLFAKAYAQAYEKNKIVHFSIDTVGHFNWERVNFKFHYLFDPKNEQLFLQLLSARLGEMHKTILLPRPRNLPRSQQVYDRLAHEQRLQSSRKIIDTVSLALTH